MLDEQRLTTAFSNVSRNVASDSVHGPDLPLNKHIIQAPILSFLMDIEKRFDFQKGSQSRTAINNAMASKPCWLLGSPRLNSIMNSSYFETISEQVCDRFTVHRDPAPITPNARVSGYGNCGCETETTVICEGAADGGFLAPNICEKPRQR